jgi:hypothetical protein
LSYACLMAGLVIELYGVSSAVGHPPKWFEPLDRGGTAPSGTWACAQTSLIHHTNLMTGSAIKWHKRNGRALFLTIRQYSWSTPELGIVGGQAGHWVGETCWPSQLWCYIFCIHTLWPGAIKLVHSKLPSNWMKNLWNMV